MNKLRMLMYAFVLPVAFVLTACGDDDEDEPSMSSTESIMSFIGGKSFRCESFHPGDESYSENTHIIGFVATGESNGTFEHECHYKDVSVDGTNRGTVRNSGVFNVEDGRINITVLRGNTLSMNYFNVVGRTLVSDHGDVFELYGEQSSDGTGNTSASSHDHPLSYWQTQYNTVISQLWEEFQSLDVAKSAGDTKSAQNSCAVIKRLQQQAKDIRKAAAEDGWTLEADALETKPASAY